MNLTDLLRKFHIIHTWRYYEIDVNPLRKKLENYSLYQEIENRKECIKCKKVKNLGRDFKYLGEL